MKKALMIALFLVSAVSFAQQKGTLKQNGISVKGNTLTTREVPPTWPGCSGSITQKKNCFNQKLANHVVKGFKFPKGHKPGTKVTVTFVIDKNGDAVVKKIAGGPKPLQDEVKRQIGSLPKMKPGHMGGTPREIQYTMPFTF
ncbi:MAG: protein TonB [Flavobacteriales bacterium]|jgi:hypothetical protein